MSHNMKVNTGSFNLSREAYIMHNSYPRMFILWINLIKLNLFLICLMSFVRYISTKKLCFYLISFPVL